MSADTETERDEVIRGGRYGYHPNADVYVLPTTEQRVVWTASVDALLGRRRRQGPT